MFKNESVWARLAVGALVLQLMLGCALPLPTEDVAPQPMVTDTGDPSSTTSDDVTVNVAAMARLGETTEIEILRFVETPSAGYTSVATISDADVISRIVDTLDSALALGPRATCVEKYRLVFTLSSGTTHTFNYLCQDGANMLRGDVPFLAEGDVQPPQELQMLIEQQINTE